MQFPVFNFRGHVQSFKHNEYHMVWCQKLHFFPRFAFPLKQISLSQIHNLHRVHTKFLVYIASNLNKWTISIVKENTMYESLTEIWRKSRTHDTAASAPKCSPPTSASSNCYFLINVKPDEERILCAWLPVIFLAKTDF